MQKRIRYHWHEQGDLGIHYKSLPHTALGSRQTTCKDVRFAVASLYLPPRFDKTQLEDTWNSLETFVELSRGDFVLIIAGDLSMELESQPDGQ